VKIASWTSPESPNPEARLSCSPTGLAGVVVVNAAGEDPERIAAVAKPYSRAFHEMWKLEVPCSSFANTVLVAHHRENRRSIGEVLCAADGMVTQAGLKYDLAKMLKASWVSKILNAWHIAKIIGIDP
jgi:hypothetical protein